jgi:beta-phosphoglucomutase-like phosphatase (HAD superfamily)
MNDHIYFKDYEVMMIEISPKAKALIFDIDGTLADTMDVHYRAWEEVAARYGFIYPRDVFDELAGIPTKKIMGILNERFHLNFTEAAVMEKEQAFLKLINEVKPIEPIAEIARKYKGILPMALGTGGTKYFAELTIKTIGFEGFFDILVSADDVENHKPAPDTFLKCAHLMKVEPEFCVVFEDGIQGFEAARRAGMIVVDVRPYLIP